MNVFQFFIMTGKGTNYANNVTHYLKLGRKRRESSTRNYHIISPTVMIKAIIITEERWWSDMEFIAHRLKTSKIEHTTITVRVLPHEPL